MRHLIGILYNNRIMIPENLITTIGNTVSECARSKQSETGKQTGRHRAVHRVLWSGTTVPRGTLTHGPRLSRRSLTTICFPLIQKHSLRWFVCKNRASSFKKLSVFYVQMKCRSTEESSVCLQNSHRIQFVQNTFIRGNDYYCHTGCCLLCRCEALMSVFWKLFGIILPVAISPCSPRLVAHWSQAGLSLVSTWMGDLLGKLGWCWKRC